MNAATPTRAFVGLGSNLGDAHAAVQAALNLLAGLPRTRVVATSALYRTAPIDAQGPEFVNAVAELRTQLPPHDLLRQLHRIEKAYGRERPYRNAPRTLDLDLLLYGQVVIGDADLIVPHPRMHERAFVLVPLSQLAPDLVIPGRGTVRELVEATSGQPVSRMDESAPTRPSSDGAT